MATIEIEIAFQRCQEMATIEIANSDERCGDITDRPIDNRTIGGSERSFLCIFRFQCFMKEMKDMLLSALDNF